MSQREDTVLDKKTEKKTKTSAQKKTAVPKMQSIWYLNDETTHLEFVVDSLIEVFNIGGQQAFKMALDTHHHQKSGFLVLKAGQPVIAEKVKQLNAMIKRERESLGYEIRDEEE